MRPVALALFALALALFAPALAATGAGAHETWLDVGSQPQAGVRTPGVGDVIVADIRHGERFQGRSVRFRARNVRRLEVHAPSRVHRLRPAPGARPAVRFTATEAGLHVVVHVSAVLRTSYTAPDQFERFVREYDLRANGRDPMVRTRALPGVFSEAYTRHNKALVPVLSSTVPDRTIGLALEIVMDEVRTLRPRGRVLFDGRPAGNVLVRVFSRPAFDAAAPAKVRDVRTDGEGRFAVAVRPLDRVLLSTVHLREPDPALALARDVAWETLWATTTFVAPQ